METVVCTATHPVDLDDGRSLPPGETADIDEKNAVNAALLDAGQLCVVGGKDKPHPRKTTQEKEVES